MKQLDLFEWAANRPSNVIDAVPALIRRICRSSVNQPHHPGEGAKVILLARKAA